MSNNYDNTSEKEESDIEENDTATKKRGMKILGKRTYGKLRQKRTKFQSNFKI
jgi:hypothetical protein